MKKSICMYTMMLTMGMAVWTAAVWAVGPYTDNGNGTVTDQGSDLIWQQATSDTNDDGTINLSDELTWQAALAYCENLDMAGQTDWRLPNIRELKSIVDPNRYKPAIDPIFMSQSSHYWSATTGADFTDGAWNVSFYSGYDGWNTKGSVIYVRCVRSGL